MKNKFNIRGEVTAVFVSFRGEMVECIIDTKSLEKLHEFEGTFRGVWNDSAKGIYVMGYDMSYNPPKNTMIHRYLTGADDTLVVDHIHHNTLDNRLEQLRVTTQSINMLNKDTSKPSYKKVTGLLWYENKKKWRAYAKRNGKYNHIGYFLEYDDALKALENFKNQI